MSDWINLLLLLAEAGLYFAAMAGLFRLRGRFGIGIVFCALGTMHFLETYLAAILYLQLPGAVVISPGSIVLFSGKLAILLLVYIREDAAAVRQPIYGLLVGNFLMVALVFLMRLHDIVPSMGGHPLDLRLMDEMGGLMIWGTILLFIDSILIILLYEATADWFGRRQLARLVFSLGVVLTFDQIGFFTALHLVADIPIGALFSGWMAKMGAAIVFGAMTAFYLRYVEGERTVRGAPRLVDVFDTLTYRQRRRAADDAAGRDPETGLLGRARFDSEGRSLVNDALRRRRPLSLILLAVDGPAEPGTARTAALGQAAGLARDALRGQDRLYRHGPTEIVALCDGLPHRAALTAAERLCQRLGAALSAAASPLTASAGVATGPLDGTDIATLIAAAAHRRETARRDGGDRAAGRRAEDDANVAHFPDRESG